MIRSKCFVNPLIAARSRFHRVAFSFACDFTSRRHAVSNVLSGRAGNTDSPITTTATVASGASSDGSSKDSVSSSAAQNNSSSNSGSASLSVCERGLPPAVVPILTKAGAISSEVLPRCAWGYLYSVAGMLLSVQEDPAATLSITEQQRRRGAAVKVETDFRPEFDLLNGTGAGTALRNLRDAVSLLDEAVASNDTSLRQLATEEIEQIARDFPVDEASDVLRAIADASDELSSVSDKWTIETLGRAGGEEASIFARELKEMYRNYCERARSWSVEDISEPDAAGGTLRIAGKNIYKFLQHEIGVHRVQRVPTTEASGRIQTSTVSVFLMPLPSAVSVDINPADCEIDMVRGSGPGGQGVNSSSNACRLLHKPTGITIRCHYHRSGNANREMALDMLAQKLWRKKFEQSKRAHNDIFASQWSSGERGERMRTYNFPQNRVTDHRFSNWTCNTAAAFMTGTGPLEELHQLAVAATEEAKLRTTLDERIGLAAAAVDAVNNSSKS